MPVGARKTHQDDREDRRGTVRHIVSRYPPTSEEEWNVRSDCATVDSVQHDKVDLAVRGSVHTSVSRSIMVGGTQTYFCQLFRPRVR